MSIRLFWEQGGENRVLQNEVIEPGEIRLLEVHTLIDDDPHALAVERYRYMQGGGGRISMIPLVELEDIDAGPVDKTQMEKYEIVDLLPGTNVDMFKSETVLYDKLGEVGILSATLDNSPDYYHWD